KDDMTISVSNGEATVTSSHMESISFPTAGVQSLTINGAAGDSLTFGSNLTMDGASISINVAAIVLSGVTVDVSNGSGTDGSIDFQASSTDDGSYQLSLSCTGYCASPSASITLSGATLHGGSITLDATTSA